MRTSHTNTTIWKVKKKNKFGNGEDKYDKISVSGYNYDMVIWYY